jgi:WD40 repeat protein
MKASTIFFFFYFFCEIIAAQNVACFEHFRLEGEAAVNRRRPNFELARKKFSAAKECPEATADQRRSMDERIRTVEKQNLTALESQIDRAEKSEILANARAAEAEIARETANIALADTKNALAEAEKRRLESEAATRHALANDLAFKAQTALRDGDRTTALRLSEFAWRFVEPSNQRARQTILDVFYQNDRRTDAFQQPWRSANWNVNDDSGAEKIQFSNDGKRIAVESFTGNLFIWEILSGRELFFYTNIFKNQHNAVFSDDLQKIAISTNFSEISIFDLEKNASPRKISIPNDAGLATMVFSKNGQSLTICSSDWSIETIDVETGKPFENTLENLNDAFGCTLSPDQNLMLVFGEKGKIAVLDLKKNIRQSVFELGNPYPTAIHFSPQNTFAAIACADKSIGVWRLADGQKTTSFAAQGEAAVDLYFSLDGQTLTASFHNSGQKTWNLTTGQQLNLDTNPPEETYIDVVFSPDNTSKMVISYDRGVEVFEHPSGKKRFALSAQNEQLSYSFSPDSRLIFVGKSDGSAMLVDVLTGKIRAELPLGNEIMRHSFSSDSRQLAIARQRGGVDIWNLETHSEISMTAENCAYKNPFFSKNGKLAAIPFFGDTIRIYDLITEKPLFSIKNAGFNAFFSPDGTKMISYYYPTKRIYVTDLAKPTEPVIFELDTLTQIYDARFLKNEQNLRLMTNHVMLEFDLQSNKTIKRDVPIFWEFISKDSQILVRQNAARTKFEVFEIGSNKQISIIENPENQSFTSVSISPDGKKLLALETQVLGKIWDLSTGKMLHKIELDFNYLTKLVWSPDGKQVISTQGVLASWNVETGEPQFSQYLNGTKIAFSPDLERVAVIDHEREIRVIDLKTGLDLITLRGHSKDVLDVQFSPDNRTILTASNDQTARIWDAKTGRELLRLRGDSLGMESAHFTKNGQKILIYQGNSFRFWQINPDSIIEKLKIRGNISGLSATQIYDFNLEESLVSATDFNMIIGQISASQCLEVARFYAQQADLVNDLARFNLYFERAELLFQKVANELGNPSLSLELADLYSRWSQKLFQNGQQANAKKRAERVEKLLSIPEKLPISAQQDLAFAHIATGKIDAAARIYGNLRDSLGIQPLELLAELNETSRLLGGEEKSVAPLRRIIETAANDSLPLPPIDEMWYPTETQIGTSAAYFEQKDYKNAIEIGRLELKNSIANSLNYGMQSGIQNVPDLFGSMSFYLLFDKKYEESLEMAQYGLAIDSARTFIYTNLAHAFLFTGQTEKAFEIYKLLKSTPDPNGDIIGEEPKSFAPILLADFELFAKAGIYHREIPKVIELLLGRKVEKSERGRYY